MIAETIKQEVADFLKVPMDVFKSKSRDKIKVEARFMAMAFMRNAGMYLTAIGKEFDRDHTTVLHGLAKVEDYKFSDSGFRAAFELIEKNIQAKIYIGSTKSKTYKRNSKGQFNKAA